MEGRQRAAWMRIACFKKGRLPGDCDTLRYVELKITMAQVVYKPRHYFDVDIEFGHVIDYHGLAKTLSHEV